MQVSGGDRYYLFGVPAGFDDDKLKCAVGELIGHPEGILAVHWYNPVINDQIGGAVGLKLDENAVALLQEIRYLTLNGKQVTFVDREEIPIKASATIDDSIVELCKSKLSQGQTWEAVVGNLTTTKKRNEEEGYDFWLMEGPFSEVKRFNALIHEIVLLKKIVSESSTIGEKRFEDIENRFDDNSTATAVKSGDMSPVQELEPSDSSPRMDVITSQKMEGTSNQPQPLQIEFVVGDITKQRYVDAIVNPTNFKLEATSNDVSKAISTAMGVGIYEAVCKEALEAQWGSIPDTFVAMTGGGNLYVKRVIHVVMPQLGKFTKEKAIQEIGTCYSHCFERAKKHRSLSSIAFPPLGLESGAMMNVAIGGAVSALIEASYDQVPSLAQYLHQIRFVFPTNEVLASYLEVFQTHFEVNIRSQNETGG